MSLLLKALNKAEGEEEQKAEAASPSPSASVDFDTLGAATPPVQTASGGVGVEEKRQQIVSATRVFGAGEEGKKTKGGFFKAVVVMGLIIVLGGGGYFGLESAGISVSRLIGVDIAALLDEPKVIKSPAKPSVGRVLAAATEGRLLLPQPSIDVQSEINFAALRPQNPSGEITETRDEFRERIAVITGFDIDEVRKNEAEEAVAIEEEADADATQIEVEEFSAENSRQQKAKLDARTPSDSRLGGLVIRNLAVVRENALPVSDENVDEADDVQSTASSAVEAETKIADVKVSTSEDGQERKRMLNRARSLYRDGAYAEAEAVYKNVLRRSPTSVDALRGIAQLALATRRYQLAVATYLKILNLYPGDPFAVSGLTNLGGDSLDSREVERSLKDLIGKNPDLDGRIYFSLGNVYAKQQRWIKSQESYFQAFSKEPENPDYAYNLAVTLDYLNKPKLALRYYGEAVRLAKKSKLFGFNVSVAEARISVLQDN